jgi:FkbM family methyltransferase
MLKDFLVNNFAFLGKYKRFIVAFFDWASFVKITYSQHEEDKFIWDILQGYDLKGSIYVDIGANHPTDISNTYLLYRKGLRGIIIEPNEELVALFRKFRKRDTILMIGCSNISALLKFNISKTPVVSSFTDSRDINIYKSIYLPVMPIDIVLLHLDFQYINFLSIDVEGLNYEVLQGAKNTIKKSLIICVEYDTDDEKDKLTELIGTGFDFLAMYGCNMIYINKELKNKKKLTSLTVNRFNA